jgi:penicillin-insensitive murein endopeptidase
MAGLLVLCFVSVLGHAEESACYGTPSNGRLGNGVQIEKSGPNFAPYSSLGVTLGRTYVHSRVAKVIVDSYASLAELLPDTNFVYGESGWSEGGRIRPHRTHQNGLAVDFMVAVRNKEGTSVQLPSSVTNKFGYGIDFDRSARYGQLVIDFEAVAEHLHALHSTSKKHGVGMVRVIFDPQFIPKLYRTKHGAFIKDNITFMQGQAWIRHDEHYHVDFSVPCKPLKS